MCKVQGKRNNDVASRCEEGQKRCSICEIFIKCDETYCPCCHYKLRTRSFGGWGMRKKYKEETVKRY